MRNVFGFFVFSLMTAACSDSSTVSSSSAVVDAGVVSTASADGAAVLTPTDLSVQSELLPAVVPSVAAQDTPTAAPTAVVDEEQAPVR